VIFCKYSNLRHIPDGLFVNNGYFAYFIKIIHKKFPIVY